MKDLPGRGNYSPPDDPPSVYDRLSSVENKLYDAGIPDYLVSILAYYAFQGWKPSDAEEMMQDLKKAVTPIIEDTTP